MLDAILDQAARALDSAMLWRLGSMPVPPTQNSDFPPVEVGSFWAEARLGNPGSVIAFRELGRRMNGAVRIADMEAPSRGHGTHPGSRKLIARAYLRDRDRDAPFVVLLHGYAVPTPIYEQGQCRQLNRLGASAVRLDHPWHLRRRARGLRSGEGYMTGDPGRLLASVRQSVEDAAALVAWGRTMSSHVAVIGVSLGGLTACLLAAQIELDAMIAVAPFCDPPTTFRERIPLGMRRRLGLAGDTLSAWLDSPDEAKRILDAAFAPIVVRNQPRLATPAERITLIRPANDIIVGPEPIAELAQHWGTEMWDLRHSHISVLRARGLHDRMYERLLRRPEITSTGVPLAG